jgi:hypothetical protein
MTKSIITLLIFILLWGCSNRPQIIADLASLQKNSESSSVETGNFGGGTLAKSKSVVLSNVEIQLANNGSVLLNFTDSAGGINFSPERVKLPASWEKCTKLVIKLQNENSFPTTVSFGIRGRWLRGMNEFTLQSGESKTLSYSLNELSLIGPKESPYSPAFIAIEASGKAKNWNLKIASLTLETDENWNAEPVVDRYGQRKNTSWEGKITSDNMLEESLQDEYKIDLTDISGRDGIGGLEGKKLKATGFFRYEKVGDKWWFVTPEGNLFWSLGVTGIRPKNDKTDVTHVLGREYLFDYLPEKEGQFASAWVGDDRFSFYYLNLLRKYGQIDRWRSHVFERLNHWGINTIGNWSEDSLLYQSPIPFTKSFDTKIPGYAAGHGVSDFFHPGWASAVDSVLREALRFNDNKNLLGYFVDNEQGWGKGDFSGFLETLSDSSWSRKVWEEMLRQKYKAIEKLNQQRKTSFSSWDEVRLLKDRSIFSQLQEEIVAFETAFAAQYFSVVSSTLKKYDPNHLYLGCRFTRQPKPLHIMQTAGKYCDVITVNVYTFIPQELEIWHNATQKPILIGEHHVPLASERQFPPNYKCFPEDERKAYYLNYVERWAKMPFSLGCHWYQFADQHLTGRSTDGECQTVGLVDITDQPHQHMIEAVNKAAVKIYDWHLSNHQKLK